ADYVSNSYFSNSSSQTDLSQIINPALTSVTLTSSPSSVAVHDPVTFKAQVQQTNGSHTPTGYVIFYEIISGNKVPLDNSTQHQLDSNGVATLTLNTLSQGTHQIHAEYTSSSYFSSSVSSPDLSQVINPALTTTTLSTSGSPSVVPDSV